MSYCLDAWAVLAWLDGDEPAASVVQRCLDQERPTMSWINLVEVEYSLRRRHGSFEAENSLLRLRRLLTEDLPGVARMRSVAALKADHHIALGDCFAIATAAARNDVLITGDPEILDLAEQLPCGVRDARAAPRGDAG